MRRAWLGTVATNAAILVSGMATGIFAARLLGPADRGLLAAVMMWPQTIAGLASLSLGEALVARRATASVGPERLVASGNAAALAAGVLGLALGAPLLPWLLGPEREAAFALATLYLAGFIPLSAFAVVLVAADQAERRFTRLNFVRLGPSWFYLGGIGLLWLADAVSVATLVAAAWLGAALTTAIQIHLARRAVLARPDLAEIRALLALGARFHVGAVLALLAGQADRMLLLLLFDDATVGHYVVAWTFASSGLATVTNAVSFVLLPVLAAEPDRGRARALLATGLRRTALFLYLGVAASLAVTPLLLPLLFGAAFADAVPAAMLLLLATVSLTLRQTVVRCLRAFAEARIAVTSEAAALLAFLLTAGPLALASGANGIAAATIAGNLAGLVLCARHLARAHGIPASAWLAPGPTMLGDGWSLGRRLVLGMVGAR
ncbi:MAG: oligosaccharide flippase family protein [Geminicoccaceae bacterium]|nr:oligosaccharide flippase family protein [Geminicoccaceae bacterium]